ncbi:MAG TPA: hypothetical protein VFL73_10555, partial [Solirubrobacteraceae bacterium]|nr:hypothetical protein [Solirubrobacteraceae bacterium]
DWMRGMERRLAALEGRSAFYGTGVHPNGEQGLDSDNYVAGESGFSLRGGSGDAEFNELTLRAGIIGDNALASLVRFDVMQAQALGFAVPVGLTTVASQTWVAPAGFTRVSISVVGKVFAYNPTSALDYIASLVRLVRVSDGAIINGPATWTAASGSGGSGTSVTTGVAVFALNANDSIRLEVQATTSNAAWAANPDNQASLAGSITWSR